MKPKLLLQKVVLFFALIVGCIMADNLHAQVTVAAPGVLPGPYANLSAAFAALNVAPGGTPVTINFMGNTIEPPIPQPLLTPPLPWLNVAILGNGFSATNPALGSHTISIGNGLTILPFPVTIDNLTVLGLANNPNSGVIYINGTNNRVLNSTISNAGLQRVSNGVFVENGNTQITNCNFFDFMSPMMNSNGIHISGATGMPSAIIFNCNFYETTAFTSTAPFIYRAIYVTSPAPQTIDKNLIGGNMAGGGGVWIGSGNAAFTAIELLAAATLNATVTNNNIQNFGWASDYALNPLWRGIVLRGTDGNTTISNNMIDKITTNYTGASGTGETVGIDISKTLDAVDVTDNTISNISSQSSGASGHTLYGIRCTGTVTQNYANNTLNNFSTSTSGTAASSINGIFISGGDATLTTTNTFSNFIPPTGATGTGSIVNGIFINVGTNNTSIANQSFNFTAGGVNRIHNAINIADGTNTISDNIYNITSTTTDIRAINITDGTNTMNGITLTGLSSTGSGAVRGIFATGGTNNVSNSTIHGLSSGAGSVMRAIAFDGGTNNAQNNTIRNLTGTGGAEVRAFSSGGGTNTYSKNFIHSLVSGTTGIVRGFFLSTGGSQDLTNNIIALTGEARTMEGIYGSGGTRNVCHNTVYIGGSTAATTGTISSAGIIQISGSVAFTSVNNNIFVNERTGLGAHHAFNFTINPTASASNDYKTSFVGALGGALNTALTFVTPGGTLATDYEPVNANNAASSCGSVTDDYFGTPRMLNTVGAFEVAGCAVSLAINAVPIVSDTYQASGYITSTGTVANDSLVVFEAGDSIVLKVGFHALADNYFLARIVSPCVPAFAPETPEARKADIVATKPKQPEAIIMPNPTSSHAIVRYFVPTEGKVQIYLFDVGGRVVGVKHLGVQSDWQETTIEAEKLPKGLYFVGIRTNEGLLMKKLSVIK